MAASVFKTGPFAGFSVQDEFAKAAIRETTVVLDIGPIPWPDRFAPTAIPFGSYSPGQKITGPVNFKADVLILLYTDLETSAFLDVFSGNKEWSPARKSQWCGYAHNFTSLASNITGISDSDALKSGLFGYLNAVQIGSQKVALYKTELHAKVNGDKLPIIPVVQQLVKEIRPSLVMSTGTAGGTGSVLKCGDVAITSSARFRVSTRYPTYPKINSLSQSSTVLANSVSVNTSYVDYAAQNLTKLTLPGLANCYRQLSSRPGYGFLKKNTTAPSIYFTNGNSVPGPEPMTVVTADFLSADDSTNAEGLEALGITNENDDAYAFFAISQMPAADQPQWLSVRNVSDPQVVASSGSGSSQQQIVKQISSVAGAIFGVYQYITTINSALACWGVVAGQVSSATSVSHSIKSKASRSAMPAATNSLRIPITNIYGGGDYTARVNVGSQNAPVNLILDTGSSTIAVKTSRYDPKADSALKATAYAQEVLYGTGGWAGPLVTTNVSLGKSAPLLKNAYLAIADDQLPDNFGAADGILGLAYGALNQAYNLATYLADQKIKPAVTYPWPFSVANSTAALAQVQSIFKSLRYDDIPPYFQQLETQRLTSNKFAFYTLRSYPSMATSDPSSDPLNSGYFILGGGEEQNDLYNGDFVNVDVLDDAWYNVNLKAVQIGSANPVAAAPLPTRFAQQQISNAIVDSGTNGLLVATDVYQTILLGLQNANKGFIDTIEKAAQIQKSSQGQKGLPVSQVKLNQWPNISFILTGDTGQNVTLSVMPQNYWQVNTPSAGQAIFNIGSSGMPQSILGLPLMNNYFTVFDRSQDAYGVIRFAPISK